MAVCDNGQTVVASTPTRMVAHDVPNDPSARAGLSPVAWQATDILGGPCDAVAAVGYSHGEAGKTCLAAGLTPAGARPLTAANAQLGLVSKAACRCDQATATSQGPAGAPLPFRLDAVAPGRHIRYDATPAGGGWALKPQGTRRQGGRRSTRGGDAHLVEAMEQRGRRRPEVMQQCQPWVEHPCGTMQRGGDAGSCLIRGLEKVRTECSGTVLAYTLRRGLTLVERPRLLAARGCEGRGPARSGVGVRVGHGCAWPAVAAMAELYRIA